MKKPVSVLFLVFLILIFCSFSQAGVGQAQPEFVVVPDDFGSIQQAIDNVKEGGKVFVHKGTCFENLTITKSLVLMGEDCKTTIIDAQLKATVILVCADNVTITGFTVKISDTETPSNYMRPDKLHGIHLLHANYCNISGNKVTYNGYGIWLYDSNYNSISENNCTDNWTGIRMEASGNNQITENSLQSNHYGIRFYGSQNNLLKGNTIRENNQGFRGSEDSFVNQIDESNTLNDKPIIYWNNQHQRTVQGDVAFVFLLNCSEIVVQNLNFVTGYYGVVCINSKNCTIQNCNIKDHYYGIWLYNSSNITVTQNNLTENNLPGTVQLYVSNNNTISKKKFIANFYSIKLSNSTYNSIFENTIIDGPTEAIAFFDASKHNKVTANNISNNRGGIWFQYPTANTEECYSNYNLINKNVIKECKDWGILLGPTSQNTFTENNITNNGQGVRFYTKENTNIFYLNNFENNTVQVNSKSIATWSKGSKGNFWSDYKGKDNNGDGIGDTPYIINENNVDNSPLMKPTVIPEFSSWTLVPLIFAGIILILTTKKKLSKTTKTQTY